MQTSKLTANTTLAGAALLALASVCGCVTEKPPRVSERVVTPDDGALDQRTLRIKLKQAVEIALKEIQRRNMRYVAESTQAYPSVQGHQRRSVWHVSCQHPPEADWIVTLDADTGRILIVADMLARRG